MKKWKRWLLVLCIIGVLGFAYWKFAIPTHRIEIHSELVMLGNLDNNNRWTAGDLKLLDVFLDDPFADSGDVAWRLDPPLFPPLKERDASGASALPGEAAL
jgi:hypothetical protein